MKNLMRNLRVQLLLSHLLLVLLMALVMSGAVVSFFRLGGSIDRVLRNNYQSVVAAQNMKETLERQDSAATFFLAGQVERARRQYEANDPLFAEAYSVEAHNVTEPGEQAMADDIGRLFRAYRVAIRQLLYASPPMESGKARAYYFSALEPAFLHLKQRAQDVLDINQKAIVRANGRARREAERAARMGVGVTLAAALAATLLALDRINRTIRPLRVMAAQAEEIGAGRLDQYIEIRSSDEIGALAKAFNGMAEKLRVARAAYVERLQRAERMSDAALENLYDPVVVTDANGAVVHLNRAAEGLFGTEELASGRFIAEVVGEARITDAVMKAVRQERVSAEEDESALVAFTAAGDGREQRTYRLRVTPMIAPAANASGSASAAGAGTCARTIGAVAVLEDVTYLREIDRLKTEFIGVASHELRTPVTSLLISVDLLREGAVGRLTPEQREVVEAQREDLARLERMMGDLLDLTRFEAGVQPPRLQIVAPLDLMVAARDSLMSQAVAKGLTLSVQAAPNLPPVRADRGQIGRVLGNLLSNAIRHTPSGGAVTLEAQPDPLEPVVRFTVTDNGTGIAAEYLPHIFERFVQVPGATRGGAGLGLSIAQTIVQAHGGCIHAESGANGPKGGGSRFVFTLPRAKAGEK